MFGVTLYPLKMSKEKSTPIEREEVPPEKATTPKESVGTTTYISLGRYGL